MGIFYGYLIIALLGFIKVFFNFFLSDQKKNNNLQKKRKSEQETNDIPNEKINSDQKEISFLDNIKSKEVDFKFEESRIQKDKWVSDIIEYLNSSTSVTELINISSIGTIGYKDLLNCFEWRFVRLKVLIRDRCKCKTCGIVNNYNHVHHTYYLKDSLPWEIDENALETQCNSCHEKIHERTEIKIYKKTVNGFVETDHKEIYCKKCDGSGYLNEYRHIQSGVCFRCNGQRFEKTIFENRLKSIFQSNYNNLVFPREKYQTFLKNIELDVFIKDIKPLNISFGNINSIESNRTYSLEHKFFAKSISLSKNPNIAILEFTDNTEILCSVTRHFDGEIPLFLNDDNSLKSGWYFNGDLLCSPQKINDKIDNEWILKSEVKRLTENQLNSKYDDDLPF